MEDGLVDDGLEGEDRCRPSEAKERERYGRQDSGSAARALDSTSGEVCDCAENNGSQAGESGADDGPCHEYEADSHMV
jgi:hypothetical protein